MEEEGEERERRRRGKENLIGNSSLCHSDLKQEGEKEGNSTAKACVRLRQCALMCVNVCMWGREKERETESDRE